MLEVHQSPTMIDGFHRLAQSEQLNWLAEANHYLEGLTPQERVLWALKTLPGNHALSSSFGIQSAVMLHLVNQQKPGIPVIFLDTGYLFSETYRFVDLLSERLDLDVRTYRAALSAAWQEARFGKLWEQGEDGIKRYNQMNKVEPMQRALAELEIGTWFSGLRRSQSSTRKDRKVLEIQDGRFKLLPIIDQSNKQVHDYLMSHELPYHPLWNEGYVSVGDVHTSRKLEAGMSEEETRFFGIMRECGLHS